MMKKRIIWSFLLLICCLAVIPSVQGEKYPNNTTGHSKVTVTIIDPSIDEVKKPENVRDDSQSKFFPKTGENSSYKNVLIGLLIVLIGLWLYEKKVKSKK